MGILTRFTKEKKQEKKHPSSGLQSTDTDVPAVPPKHAGKTHAWRVLAYPIVSEKAAALGAMNQYVFAVRRDTTKTDVRRAIHEVYHVRPIRVNMTHVSGTWVRYGRSEGRTKNWKKAIVTLPKGKTIQVYEGV